jgi:uncharacterized membrane protein YfcA
MADAAPSRRPARPWVYWSMAACLSALAIVDIFLAIRVTQAGNNPVFYAIAAVVQLGVAALMIVVMRGRLKQERERAAMQQGESA